MNSIVEKVSMSNSIQIIPSDPDLDSIGTAIGLKLWLEKLNKKVGINYFLPAKSEIVEDAYRFSSLCKFTAVQEFSPEDFDLTIFLDGSDLTQFFGSSVDMNSLVNKIDPEKSVLFDHHLPNQLNQIIKPEFLAQIPEASCTSEVVYHCLAAEFGHLIDQTIAERFFKSLQGDTGIFRWEIRSETFKFAYELMQYGVDWRKMMDIQIPIQEYQFSAWAVNKIKLFPDLRVGVLIIDQAARAELFAILGENWSQYQSEFKNGFGKSVKGYDAIIVLDEVGPNQVKMRWRLKDYGVQLDLREAMPKYGFPGGGHAAAGGGTFTGSIDAAEQALIAAIKSLLNK